MKTILKYALLCFLTLRPGYCLAQNASGQLPSSIDSLLSVIKTAKEDTTRANILIRICNAYMNTGNYDAAGKYAKEALALSREAGYMKGNASALGSLGLIHWYKGEYDLSVSCFNQAIKIFEEMPAGVGQKGNKRGVSATYNNLALVYWNKGDYDKAIEMSFKSLEIREALKDSGGIADSYHTIGIIYDEKGDTETAISYFLKALKIREELKDEWHIANSYNSIGIVFSKRGDYTNALEYYSKCANVYKKLDDKNELGAIYFNMGTLYMSKGDYEHAMEYYFKSLKLRDEIGDKNGVALAQINIGNLFLKRRLPVDAKKYALKGLEISLAINAKPTIMTAYQVLASIDSLQNNFKGAYEYHKLYYLYKDSIFSEEGHKAMAEMQTRYETGKKESQIQLLEEDQKVAHAENKKQEIIIWAVAVGLFLVIFFAAFIFKSLKTVRKQKQIIEVQKTEVERSRDIIESKNKDILDSIHYARRIQHSLLPTDVFISKKLTQLMK